MEPDNFLEHKQCMESIGFCQSHINYVQSFVTNEDKNTNLLDLMERRSFGQILQFIRILQETGQEKVALLLLKIACKCNNIDNFKIILVHKNDQRLFYYLAK